jgi:hypothetical protein
MRANRAIEYRRLLNQIEHGDPHVWLELENARAAKLAQEREVDRAFEEATSPRVKGHVRPRIEGRPVPKRQLRRLDLDDLPLHPGETQLSQAVERIQRLIGQRIDQTSLLDAWNKAPARVLGNRPLNSITKEEMLRKGGIYERVRDDLDEVETPLQPDCIAAINALSTKLVVCSLPRRVAPNPDL